MAWKTSAPIQVPCMRSVYLADSSISQWLGLPSCRLLVYSPCLFDVRSAAYNHAAQCSGRGEELARAGTGNGAEAGGSGDSAGAVATSGSVDAIADSCSGCVEVVGCVRSEELVCWEDVPQSVRLEGDFCWLCENPQLVVPFEMRGYQGVYNLERRVYEGAARGLSPAQGPLPVKFPLPDPRNPSSLKPGSLNFNSSKSSLVKTESVSAAIAGARAAATQYSRKGSSAATSSEIQTRGK